MIQKVSKTKERQEGLSQARYKEGNTQILLHFCKKDIVLEQHKHKQVQFGYTFYGKYHFLIDKDEDILFYINNSHSYILSSYIYHKAVALTDYYALDIKYYGEVEKRIYLNYEFPSDKANTQTFLLNGDNIKITVNKVLKNTNFKLDKGTNLILTKNQCIVSLDKKNSEILPMEIYKIDSVVKTVFHECNMNEMLIINLEDKS